MGWRVYAGNIAAGLPKPLSHFGTCAERESSVPWCLASCAYPNDCTIPDVIFEVLRSKPDLVATEDTEGKEEAVKDTGVPQIRKHDDAGLDSF
jgi:hypothetical protein